MAGLVWFVQVVHYPLLSRVGAPAFAAYEAEHLRRTRWVAGVPMGVEALAAVILAVAPPKGVPLPWPWVGLAVLAAIWASTFLREIPRHRTLLRGFDPAVHSALVAGNWRRTVGWSLRALLALAMLARAGRATPL